MAIINRHGGGGISTTDEGGKTRWQGRDEGKGSRQKGKELEWVFSWGHRVAGWGLSEERGCCKHPYAIPMETRQMAKEVREQKTGISKASAGVWQKAGTRIRTAE